MIAGAKGFSGINGYPQTAHLQAESLKRCKPDPPMPDQEQLEAFLEALETAGSPAKNPSLRGVMNGQGAFHKDAKPKLVASQIGVRGSTFKARTSKRGIPHQGVVTSEHKHLVHGGLVIGSPTGSVH